MKQLTDYSVETTFIEPTRTGLEKSIMDATTTVRDYFLQFKFHNYLEQKQGADYKRIVKAIILTEENYFESRATLYRPITKKGDPRIWISGLQKFVHPNELISLLIYNDFLYVFNISRVDLSEVLRNKNGPLYELLTQIHLNNTSTSRELLDKLRDIAKLGYIESQIDADTGVGRTLETYLGIKINSAKAPDYKGIEIKSYRGHRFGERTTLFACVPKWSLSNYKSSKEILEKFGYFRDDILKLYCTVSYLKPNSQKLQFKFDKDVNSLIEFVNDSAKSEDVAVWMLSELKKRLLEKHNETFWIKADTKRQNGKEFFQYKSVIHTQRPIISQFSTLITNGAITMDHLIKKNLSGRVSEKGPLFKIRTSSLNLLFPTPKEYSLLY
jgi:hypothetical protein